MILLGYAYILIQIEIFYNFENMNSIGVYFLVVVLAHQTNYHGVSSLLSCG